MFVVEHMTSEGEIERLGLVETEGNLFNDRDLDAIAKKSLSGTDGTLGARMQYKAENKGSHIIMVMVRPQYSTDMVYYIGGDGYWAYGSVESAENVLKKRI